MEIREITNMYLTDHDRKVADVKAFLSDGSMMKFVIKFEKDMSNIIYIDPRIDTQVNGEENFGKIWDYYDKHQPL